MPERRRWDHNEAGLAAGGAHAPARFRWATRDDVLAPDLPDHLEPAPVFRA